MTQGKILIIGCGKLGIRTARLLQQCGYSVTAGRRTVAAIPADIQSVYLDALDSETLNLLSATNWVAVIVTLTAAQFEEAAYREAYVSGLQNILAALHEAKGREVPGAKAAAPASPLLLFASSTSVYAQDDGSLVDEQSETRPTRFSGRVMLEAEQLLQESTLCTSAIRFAGIYGAGEGRLAKRAASGLLCPLSPLRYSNRIHIDDCARLFVHLIQRFRSGKNIQPHYLAVDNAVEPLRDVMEWLAREQGVNPDQFREGAAPQRGGNKRCCNRLLVESGFEFIHPDFKSGYKKLLQA